MRSYYTYGAIPDPVRTVRGFDNGGLASTDSLSTWKGSPELGASLLASDRLARERQLEPGALGSFVGPTGTGTPIMPGNFSMLRPERSAAEIASDYAKASGLDLAGFAASQGKTEAELMADINKAETDPNTRRGALNIIKDKASAGDFKGAFQEAKAAEARLGGDFVSNLVSPSTLRYMSPEMDKQDVNNYYDALKEVIGEKEYEKRYVSTGNEFSIEDARAKNLAAVEQGQNFVNPDAGVKAEETLLSKLPIKQLALLTAAAMGATAIPGLLGGASGASGAGAGAAGAAGGAGAAGAGAAGAGAAGAAGAGALGAAGAASVLPEVVVAATKLGLTIPQYLALAGGTGALASTVGGGAGGAGTVTTPTAPTEPTGGLDQLEEVVVKAKPPVTPPIIPPVVVPPTGGLTTPPTEPTPPEDTLEEVEVKAKKPPPVEPPPVITPPLSPPTEPPPTEPPPEDTLEEVEVKAKKPPQPDIPPPVITPPPSPPPPEPPPADGGLEEVEVTAKKPPPVMPPPVIPPMPDFPEPPLKEPPPDPLKDQPKPKDIEDPDSPLNKILKDPKNLLKIIGALTSATTSTGPSTTPVGQPTGTGGFGGALPKYTYERQQFAPPIDYYTYGTRPEAKFFEGSYKLAEPTQPPLTPPEEPPVPEAAGGYIDENMTGGLIGYAEGGKPERYVDGPGSGRDDKIPALLSDGEYVIDAETLALLGDGSSKEGARRMDQFRAKIRQHKGRALSRGRISPNAKSPEKYMGGGLS